MTKNRLAFFIKNKGHINPQEMSTMTEIQYGSDYKTFGGFKYHLNFPDEWILNELPNTGRECKNCVGDGDNKGYGMWRGIVLGYCANCAMDYDMDRCRGFIGCGVEVHTNSNIVRSAFEYLGEIDWDNYGDLEINPNDTLENRAYFLEPCDEDPEELEEFEDPEELEELEEFEEFEEFEDLEEFEELEDPEELEEFEDLEEFEEFEEFEEGKNGYPNENEFYDPYEEYDENEDCLEEVDWNCITIGCGDTCDTRSPYCVKHREQYDP